MMPRKQQGWITFKSSETERQILDRYCQQFQRTKTEVLRELLRNLDFMSQHLQERSPASEVVSTQRLERQAMKLSARNVLKGTVKQVVVGAVNTEVTLELAPGIEVTSIITKASAEHMGLAEGNEAYAVVKASDVMIAVD